MNPCRLRLKKILRNKSKFKVLKDTIIGHYLESVERRNNFGCGNEGDSLSGK